MRSWLVLLFALVPSVLASQSGPPELIRDALQVRLPFCQRIPTVSEDSVPFYPRVRLFVGQCEAEYGAPGQAVVALDTADVFYLLDSPASFQLLETRIGHPQLNATNRLEYAFMAAKLAAVIPWDATLQLSTEPTPDPRDLAPTFPTKGTCASVRPPWRRLDESTWIVGFHAATSWWVGHITVRKVGARVSFTSTTVCSAQHNP